MKRQLWGRFVLVSSIIPFIAIAGVFFKPHQAAAASSIDVWWPTTNAVMSGTQPFQAMIPGLDPSQYQMFWEVDGGQWNPMSENDTGSPHMEADVDLSGWTWHGNGPYTVTFIAQTPSGSLIDEQSESIYVGTGPSSGTSDSSTPSVTTDPSTTTNTTSTQSAGVITTATTTAPPTTPTPTTPAAPTTTTTTTSSIDVWWPTTNAVMSGTQPFQAMIPGLDPSQYQMFWEVDGGQWNPMSENDTGSPHMEADVDLSGWTWHGNGPYTVTFIAQTPSGSTIDEESVEIYVGSGPSSTAANPTTTTVDTSTSSNEDSSTPSSVETSVNSVIQQANQTIANISDSLSSLTNGSGFYVNPNSEAAMQEQTWESSDSSGASAMATLAAQPTATWIVGGSDPETQVAETVNAASIDGTTPVLVAYDIPDRDCGGASSGGATSSAAYTAWIQSFAAGIGDNKAIVILEPDALAEISCLSSADQATRLQLIGSAVTTLKENPNTAVYIDAGHEDWIDPSTMAQELEEANIAAANGFSLNVSNFEPTSGETTYGEEISQGTGGKHFVIDTSRNGNGSTTANWCNPSGMAIGTDPTTNTGNPLVDAFLWIKVPGESDGNCNGGPSAGTWWPAYALELVENA